jgi:5,10-methylenetetrahydrofolate reductase
MAFKKLQGCRVLPTSLDLLRTARDLQSGGDLPSGIELWAAANPITEPSAARLEAKVEAGATTFLTQPPLAYDRFRVWMEDAHKRGIVPAQRMLVGVPLITSAMHLRFWISLCGAPIEGATQLPRSSFSGCEDSLHLDLAADSGNTNMAVNKIW